MTDRSQATNRQDIDYIIWHIIVYHDINYNNLHYHSVEASYKVQIHAYVLFCMYRMKL